MCLSRRGVIVDILGQNDTIGEMEFLIPVNFAVTAMVRNNRSHRAGWTPHCP